MGDKSLASVGRNNVYCVSLDKSRFGNIYSLVPKSLARNKQVVSVLDKYLKKWCLAVLRPLAHLFIRLGFTPDWLTLMGLVMNLGATVAFAKGYLLSLIHI